MDSLYNCEQLMDMYLQSIILSESVLSLTYRIIYFFNKIGKWCVIILKECKIIQVNDVEIIYYSLMDYEVLTPLGSYNDVNNAVEQYPYLNEHKNIRKCAFCGKYFVKVGRENATRKYCSDYCSKEAHKDSKAKWKRKQDKLQRIYAERTIDESIKNKGYIDKGNEFMQIDTPATMGEKSLLTGHRKQDFEYELKLVKKELHRIMDRDCNP